MNPRRQESGEEAREPSRMPLFAGLWAMFFFLGMSPGFWTSALTNLLHAKGKGEWTTLAFFAGPCAALFSPLIGGALADQRFRAERLLAWISLAGGLFLFAAFWALDHDWNSWWFIAFLGMQALAAGPMWGLGTMIALSHLKRPERSFPLARMGGTVGWMIAGLLTSLVLQADRTADSGYAAAVTRVVLGLLMFTLPATYPTGRSRSWTSLLGLDAFVLLRNRDHFVFFVTTGLLSVPLAAFYMYVPRHLEALGDSRASATMTLGQWSEIAAMIAVGAVMSRCKVKTVLMWAIGITFFRYCLFAAGGVTAARDWLIPAVALHGIGYTFYFITAQVFLDRRVEPGLRGQAQGLLTLFSAGLGSSVGTLFVGYLYRICVVSGNGGWAVFWSVLAAITLVCLVMFGTLYRGKAAEGVG